MFHHATWQIANHLNDVKTKEKPVQRRMVPPRVWQVARMQGKHAGATGRLPGRDVKNMNPAPKHWSSMQPRFQIAGHNRTTANGAKLSEASHSTTLLGATRHHHILADGCQAKFVCKRGP